MTSICDLAYFCLRSAFYIYIGNNIFPLHDDCIYAAFIVSCPFLMRAGARSCLHARTQKQCFSSDGIRIQLSIYAKRKLRLWENELVLAVELLRKISRMTSRLISPAIHRARAWESVLACKLNNFSMYRIMCGNFYKYTINYYLL